MLKTLAIGALALGCVKEHSGPAGDLVDRALPAGAASVLGLSLSKATEAHTWWTYRRALGDRGAPAVRAIDRACGVDLSLIDGRLAVSTGDDGGVAIFVESDVERSAVERCFAIVTRANDAGLEIERDGELTRYRSQMMGGDLWVRWLGDRALLLATDWGRREPLAAVAAGDKLGRDTAMQSALAGVDRDALLWGATRVPAAGPTLLGALGLSVRPSWATFNVWDDGAGFRARIGLRYDSPRAAIAMLGELRGTDTENGPLARYLTGVDVRASGDDVVIDLELTDTAIVELIRLGARLWF